MQTAEVKPASMPRQSPWGAVQTARELAPGFIIVSTASHGGLLLDQAHRARMPDYMISGYNETTAEEPPQNDEALCCPDCETPNQFGELCPSCQRDQDEATAERMNRA